MAHKVYSKDGATSPTAKPLVPIMKCTQIGILSLLLLSCSQQPVDNEKNTHLKEQNQTEIQNQEKESEELINNLPIDFITPNGVEVKFPVVDSTYNLVWKRNNKFDTLYLSLPLIKGSHSSNPILIDENNEYLYFENGCGSPCWNGFVLPLYGERKPFSVEYPIARDLNRHCIAVIKDKDQIALYNLKSGGVQIINTDECVSSFSGYCIDSAYFEGENFVYKWGNDAHVDSGDETIKRKKVKWY